MTESETLLRAFFHSAYKDQFVAQDIKDAVIDVLDELARVREELESARAENAAARKVIKAASAYADTYFTINSSDVERALDHAIDDFYLYFGGRDE